MDFNVAHRLQKLQLQTVAMQQVATQEVADGQTNFSDQYLWTEEKVDSVQPKVAEVCQVKKKLTMDKAVTMNRMIRQVPNDRHTTIYEQFLSTPCPHGMARGRATRLCWGHVGKGLRISQLCSIGDAAQAQKTPRKTKIACKEEDRLLLNILCHILYILTIFCGYWSLVGRVS